MGKGDIERETIFHIVVMLLVLFIAGAVILGVNSLVWTQQDKLSEVFEPGKLDITNKDPQGGISNLIKFDCSQAAYTLIIDKPKFYYKGTAGKTLDFILLLDYKNVFFTGNDENGVIKEFHCTPDESGEKFQCPEDSIFFTLQGVTGVTGEQVFHFTAWKAKQVVIEMARKAAANEPGQTLFTMMDSYPESYMTSFDGVVNVTTKCAEAKCAAINDESGCNTENECYWRKPWNIGWLSGCKPCPSYTICGDYDRDACEKCATPQANCRVTTLGGCEPN
ncbi:MAG TPA: hypothetical protein VJB05_00260 [archaeon]|nr:hypothetical protein [archaeon]